MAVASSRRTRARAERSGALGTVLAGCAAMIGCQFPVSVGELRVQQKQVVVRLATAERADLLLVVDRSPSMVERQRRFADALHDRAPLLAALGSVHAATVTSDLGAGAFEGHGCHPGGDGGRLRAVGSGTPDARCPGVAHGGGVGGGDYLDLDFAAHRDNLMGQPLGDALACLALAGGDGCFVSQPLEAARRALVAGRQPASGFLRDDAVLVVIFLTDEDDCSAPDNALLFEAERGAAAFGPLSSFRCAAASMRWGLPPMPLPRQPSGGPLPQPGIDAADHGSGGLAPLSRYRDLFGLGSVTDVTLKTDASSLILASFSGPPEPLELIAVPPSVEPTAEQPSCQGPCDGATCQLALRHACQGAPGSGLFADPAPRLATVVRAAVNHYAASLCEPDDRQALADILALADRLQATSGCLGAPLLDAARPDCHVADTRTVSGIATSTPVEACRDRDDAPPCWRVDADDSCAPVTDPRSGARTAFRLRVERGGNAPVPGTVTTASCDTP